MINVMNRCRKDVAHGEPEDAVAGRVPCAKAMHAITDKEGSKDTKK